ncbi:TonB-dependent receptor [Neiella sp. HB171785]|uniref:TonB-dependent receptor n=1 Tax=Neiella litorisoli TaxID=2771431 RepID=A0A8J6QU82_9GAMM|nr:TonB-dependent receptor [Neiella litorisoli]MBD1388663.1 TonB-dependent receptor [Neiella litorisoli]
MVITHKVSAKRRNGAVLTGVASLLLTVSAPSVLADEVNKALQNEDVEVIEVSGVRSSLENALNVKRGASSIVDAISATDMDALPALDLGDALQALPGIQLNSNDEGRQSTISLRGLSSGFVKTTAFGQSIATPSAASNVSQVGAGNPFAAYEGGVFDGVTVIKSPTADLQEGGVAGVVDKQLQQALSKKDGTAGVTLGMRYEELAETYNPEIKINAVKHLIEDKLAVAFKFAASKQEFRRDTFDVVDYVSVEDWYDAGKDTLHTRATNLAEYKEKYAHLLEEGDEIRVPLRGRNVSQYSDGDRKSFTGNVEYRINDDFKVGAHILYSKRDLDDGTKETTNYEAGINKTKWTSDYYEGEVTLDMDSAPFAYTELTEDGSGGKAFIAPGYDFKNGKYQIENRKTTFEEESRAAILYGDYAIGNWVLDGKVTFSDAENNFENIGLNFVHVGHQSASRAQTGFNGTINQGGGNLSKIVVSGGFETPYVYDGLDWSSAHATASSVNTRDAKNQGRQLNAGVNGRIRDLEKDYDAAEFNVQHYTEFGLGDVLRFDSFKTGVRYSKEDLDSIDQLQRISGVDTAQISSSYLTTKTVASRGDDYFGGKIKNTFDNTQSVIDPATGQLIVNGGWVTFDNAAAIKALQTNIVTERDKLPLPTDSRNRPERLLEYGVHEFIERNRSGFWDGMNSTTDLPSNIGYNFSAEQEIKATYLTTDISGELPFDITYTGNLGVRYIETDNTFHGYKLGRQSTGEPIAQLSKFEDDYNNTLPMANIAFELHEDVIFRAAYYEGIVRPNLLAQRPTANLNETNSTVKLELPSSTVRPYEADNYDLSLEWYNRDGSAISIGYFRKDITNLFEFEEGYCPDDGSDPLVNELIGDIERVAISETEFRCQEPEPYLVYDDEGNLISDDYREVRIKTAVNNSDELKVDGYEIAIQQKLDFLPYPYDGFGGVFNYTKIDQSGSELLLTRVSPKSYNLIGYWENNGFSARFIYNWRDKQTLKGANSFLGTGERTRDERGRLDFSGSYKINKNLKVILQAFNLTDEEVKDYYGSNKKAIHSISNSGRIYKAALSYRF